MIFKNVSVGLIVFCVLLSIWLISGEPWTNMCNGKTVPSTQSIKGSQTDISKSKSIQTVPPAASGGASVIIDNIYIKNNRIFITLIKRGSGRINPEHYVGSLLKIETSKGPRQWTFTEIDRSRRFDDTGKLDFDTGIVIDKIETVRAVLTVKQVETSSKVTSLTAPLSMAITAPGTNSAVSRVPASRAQMSASMSRAVGQRTGSTRPWNLDDSGGIRITSPRTGLTVAPGGWVQIIFSMLRQVSAGMVELQLRKEGDPDRIYQTVNIGWNPAVGEPNVVTSMTLPSAVDISSGSYYITATHPEAWGISDSFTVQISGEGQIRIVRPRSGEGVTPGSPLYLDYMVTGYVPEGDITFELFKLNEDGSHGSPVQTYHHYHRPSGTGMPDPLHRTQHVLPRTTELGRYFIQATHRQATGRSANFSVTWEMEGHNFPSDYSIIDIYKQGNDIKARLRATGGDMADTLDVRVNGVDRREIIRPATDTIIQVQEVPSISVCGAFHEVFIDPNNHLHEAERRNNSLRKWIPYQGNDGYASPQGNGYSGATVHYVPCDPPRGFTSYGYTSVVVHNCSGESKGFRAETRQIGWITHTNQLNVVVPHQKFVSSSCGDNAFASRTPGNSIPPGGCGMIRVSIDDLRRVDSVLNFQLAGDITEWRTLTNPVMIDLKFGRKETIINTRTGRMETNCVYND